MCDNLTFGRTSFLLSFIRPGTDASFLVVHKSIRTGNHVGFTIDTEIELVTYVLIFVIKISMFPGTVFGWLRCFCNQSFIHYSYAT